jgi:hypothetical protein
VTATPDGKLRTPTGIAAPGVLVAISIGVTEPEPALAT